MMTMRSWTSSSRAGAVGLREDGHLGRAGEVLEQDEGHRVALLRHVLAHRRNEAADDHALALAAAGELADAAVDLAPQLVAHVGQRVARDVQPERVALGLQQLALVELDVGNGRVRRRRAAGRRPGRGRRSSPARRAGRPATCGRTRSPARPPRSAPCAARRWSRSAPARTRLSSTRAVTCCMSTRSQKSHTEWNGPSAPRASRIARTAFSPTFLTADSPNRTLPSTHREVALRRVDVRRQHLDAHVGALGDVVRDLVLRVHHRRDQRRHVLGRVVGLQVGGAVRDQRVAGGVGLVERVVGGALVLVPQQLGGASRRRRSRRSPR